MDAGRDLAALRRQSRASSLELCVAQNLAGNRRAFDAVHHEAPTQVVGILEQDPHSGNGHSRVGRGLEQEVFGGAIGFAAVFARVAAQDESVGGARGVDEVERPRLPGRAARESAQPDDRTRAARRRHHLGQCFGIGRAGHERRRYPSPRTGVGVAPI